MVKHIHAKNTPTYKNRRIRPNLKSNKESFEAQIAATLLQPREQAILAILAKAALIE